MQPDTKIKKYKKTDLVIPAMQREIESLITDCFNIYFKICRRHGIGRAFTNDSSGRVLHDIIDDINKLTDNEISRCTTNIMEVIQESETLSQTLLKYKRTKRGKIFKLFHKVSDKTVLNKETPSDLSDAPF